MLVEKITIDLSKIIKAGLSLDMHFILVCILNNTQHSLEEYVSKCGILDKSAFDTLITRGYIERVEGSITFNKLKLTNGGRIYLNNDILDHKKFFKELKEAYPNKVKVGRSYRRLHQNLDSCEKKYKDIIDSEETHKNILKCVELYFKELKDTNKLEYAQMISTWINQKNYEVYLEEAIKNEDNENIEDNYNVV